MTMIAYKYPDIQVIVVNISASHIKACNSDHLPIFESAHRTRQRSLLLPLESTSTSASTSSPTPSTPTSSSSRSTPPPRPVALVLARPPTSPMHDRSPHDLPMYSPPTRSLSSSPSVLVKIA
ncbi:UDP-glucose 6-dehydrogenase 1 [Acorus gramineus]|uniref:UDP-glucose 6-dehydrogenase 1 n=1 Tax=Acorus gramineus TaxID=55184 RepID=A0AAV9BYR3_ACOGR|nr:UDP-glucose 6-dehydrogenase 1 [Acorus gramineus]